MSRIPRLRIAAALAGLPCACLGQAITASAAFAQVPGSPGDGAMSAAYVREALLHGENLAPVSGSGNVPSLGAATATAALATGFPSPNRGGIYDPVQTSQAAPVVRRRGGMPGWQIALIAIGAALVAAVIAVQAYRVRVAHRRVLAVQRCDDGRRVPPGGALELDESPHDGAARDLLEETGIHLWAERLTSAFRR